MLPLPETLTVYVYAQRHEEQLNGIVYLPRPLCPLAILLPTPVKLAVAFRFRADGVEVSLKSGTDCYDDRKEY